MFWTFRWDMRTDFASFGKLTRQVSAETMREKKQLIVDRPCERIECGEEAEVERIRNQSSPFTMAYRSMVACGARVCRATAAQCHAEEHTAYQECFPQAPRGLNHPFRTGGDSLEENSG